MVEQEGIQPAVQWILEIVHATHHLNYFSNWYQWRSMEKLVQAKVETSALLHIVLGNRVIGWDERIHLFLFCASRRPCEGVQTTTILWRHVCQSY